MGITVSKCCSFLFDNSDEADYHNRENQQLLLKQQKDNYLYQQQMNLKKEEQEKQKQLKRQQKLLEKERLLTDIVNVANDSYLDVGIIENIENIMLSNGVIGEGSGFKDEMIADKPEPTLLDSVELTFKNKSLTKGMSLFDNQYSKFLENNPSILLKDPKITAEMFSNNLDVYKHISNKMRSNLMQLHDKEFIQFEKLVQEKFLEIQDKKNNEIGSLLLP